SDLPAIVLPKGLEQVFEVGRLDAGPGIGNAPAQRPPSSNCVAGMAFGGQSDLSLPRELDGIAQQVEQDLFEPAFIADRFPEVRRELDTHCEALFVHLRRDERERLLDGAADL